MSALDAKVVCQCSRCTSKTGSFVSLVFLFIPYLSAVGDVLLHPVKLFCGDFALRVALLQDFRSALRFLAIWAIIAAPARGVGQTSQNGVPRVAKSSSANALICAPAEAIGQRGKGRRAAR